MHAYTLCNVTLHLRQWVQMSPVSSLMLQIFQQILKLLLNLWIFLPRPYHVATGVGENGETLVTGAVAMEEPDQVKVVQKGLITPEDKKPSPITVHASGKEQWNPSPKTNWHLNCTVLHLLQWQSRFLFRSSSNLSSILYLLKWK